MFEVGSSVRVEHGKPWTSTHVTRGTVERYADGVLVIARRFAPGGRYDTLGDRILAGDHGTIEVPRGGWVLRRTYWRADGRLIGELFNIQTPVELVPPDLVRYTDLEVDVARYRDGRVAVVDEEDLAVVVRTGAISPELGDRALRIAHSLAEALRSGGDWLPLALEG